MYQKKILFIIQHNAPAFPIGDVNILFISTINSTGLSFTQTFN